MNIFEKIDSAKELLLNSTNVYEQSLADVLLHQYQSELESIKISDLV